MLLEFSNVSFSYPSPKGPVQAVEDLSFSVAKGESVALIGPSGCGKSTTLLMAAGLAKPSQGAVIVCGETLGKPRKQTAFIPQDLGLFPWRTALGNITLALKFQGVPKAEAKARALRALQAVDLKDYPAAYPKELSGGMRQRLALARAIATNADLLLMDEPLSAIDALLRESLQDMLVRLGQTQGHGQLFVTHSIEEAVYLGDRILVFSARPARIIHEIDNPRQLGPKWREAPQFLSACRQVREALEATEVLEALDVLQTRGASEAREASEATDAQ